LAGGLLANAIAIPNLMRISAAGRMLASLVFLRAFHANRELET